ncbi:MAG: hypothetical protein VXW47_01385 [Pseudomonadota bacterium]|nr:hypothetical protein [Pseudomonadota bacterium]
MKKIRKFISSFVLTLMLVGCGYKVVDKSQGNSYKITEITFSGEKKINHKIKNKLLFSSSKSSENEFIIELNTKKTRSIKEKNINNEVTKYKLVIKAEINYNLLGSTNKGSFDIQRSGDYRVSSQRIGTLNNEKKMSENLTDQIFKQISIQLNSIASDS